MPAAGAPAFASLARDPRRCSNRAMASRRSLNASNLEALGAPALAQLLIEVSTGDAVIQRRLRLALAAAEGSDGAAQAVRQRLAAIARARTFIDARRRKALLSDLDAQLQAITGPIAGADAALACELLLRLLELSEDLLDRCSDGTGTVAALFSRAAEQLGPLARQAGLAPATLAEQAAELLAENSHEQFDRLVPALQEALGPEGLALLDGHCRRLGACDGDAQLLQIAIARGDVAAYLSHFDAEDLRWRDIAATAASQLLQWGHAQQALELLDGASAELDEPDASWHDCRIAVLEALDRRDEAQLMRWQWFTRTLSLPHLREHLRRLPDFEDVEVEERALERAEHHPDHLLALQCLLEWPALPRAARHVLRHAGDWDGEATTIHSAAAERLSAEHPLAATLLLRAMVDGALETLRRQRYRQAVEHLRSCDRLASRIEDWQGHPDHHAYMAQLQQRHGGAWSFWTLLEH